LSKAGTVIDGEIRVQRPVQRVLEALGNIENMDKLTPGVEKILAVDRAASTALLKVKMSFGSVSFDKDVRVTLTKENEVINMLVQTYGLEFTARARVNGDTSTSTVSYHVEGRPTSPAGRIVLRLLGKEIVEKFSEEFKQKLSFFTDTV